MVIVPGDNDEVVAPYAADAVYVNYLDKDEGDRVPEAYGCVTSASEI